MAQPRRALSEGIPTVVGALFFLAGTACLSSCAGPEWPREADVPEYARLRAGWNALPKVSTSIACSCGTAHSIHVELSVEAPGDRLAFFVHGILSDSRKWQLPAGAVGSRCGVALVDLPGCGESDAPEPDEVGLDFYSPTHMARCVVGTLRRVLEEYPPSTRVVLVGHSLGGMVLIRLLGDPQLGAEFSETLGRVDRAVLFASPDVAFHRLDEVMARIAAVTAFEVWLADLFGILESECDEAVRAQFYDPRKAVREERDILLEILSDGPRRRAAQAMIVRGIPFDEEKLRPDWDRILEIVRRYDGVRLPCLIVWGQRDETLSAAMGYKLQAQLPDARLLILRRAMHSPQVEYPTFVARIIAASVERGFDDLGRVEEVDTEEPTTEEGPLSGADWPSILKR